MNIWDTIIIGAGPAGISAATTLAEGAANVLLIDEAPAPGGQIWRGIENASQNKIDILGTEYKAGFAEVKRLRESTAHYAFSTQVWRVETDGTVWVKDGKGIHQERAKKILIATGAMERPVPIEGWTLPGVTTIGGLQILLKREGILPQGPLVLAGTGPLFYLFASQCLAAGMHDMTLLDTASTKAKITAARYLPASFTGYGPNYLLKGMKLLWGLKYSNVPIYSNVKNIRIHTASNSLKVQFRSKHREHTLDASHVGLHEGVIPETYLPRSLGCKVSWSENTSSFFPQRNQSFQSSIENIYIAGDAGGIGGANVALLEGKLAAMDILKCLNKPIEKVKIQNLENQRRAHLSARALLDHLYYPPASVLTPPDNVMVCRCEEITSGEIRTALKNGCAGPNQVKAFLRCGMGPCQGRMCGTTLTNLTSSTHEIPIEDAGFLTVRAPIRPITLGDMTDILENKT